MANSTDRPQFHVWKVILGVIIGIIVLIVAAGLIFMIYLEHSANTMVWEYPFIGNFKAVASQNASGTTLNISGTLIESWGYAGKVTTETNGSSLDVLVHGTQFFGTSPTFNYELQIPNSINEVDFGNENKMIWQRVAPLALTSNEQTDFTINNSHGPISIADYGLLNVQWNSQGANQCQISFPDETGHAYVVANGVSGYATIPAPGVPPSIPQAKSKAYIFTLSCEPQNSSTATVNKTISVTVNATP
jgi:hypothetical protein